MIINLRALTETLKTRSMLQIKNIDSMAVVGVQT